MVRIEAGLIFAGYEFSDQTDPFEAGIGFTVPLKTKTDDFIGREALIRRKENPRDKLVGLDIDANVAVGHGDCVHVGRAADRRGHLVACARRVLEQEHRAGAARCHPCRDRHRGRDRQARRPPEAAAGARSSPSPITTRRRPGRVEFVTNGSRSASGGDHPEAAFVAQFLHVLEACLQHLS